MIGRKRRHGGRRVGRARPPAPYFRFSTFCRMKETMVIVTHDNMRFFATQTTSASTTPMPAYLFGQQSSQMMRINTNSLADTGVQFARGDPREYLGAHALFSLVSMPYASLWQAGVTIGTRVNPNGDAGVPPPRADYPTDIHRALIGYNFVQVMSMTYRWSTVFPTDQVQLTIQFPEPPDDFVDFTLEPKHKRMKAAWFRELPFSPDPLTASGLLPLMFWDDVTTTAPQPANVTLYPWPEFVTLRKQTAWKYGNRGKAVVRPYVGESVFSSTLMSGPSTATRAASAMIVATSTRPTGRLHPGISTTLVMAALQQQDPDLQLRIPLGGGFLYFFIPLISMVRHKVTQLTVDEHSSETISVANGVAPAVIFVDRHTLFRFWQRRPLGQDAWTMMSPDAQFNSRLIQGQAARMGGTTSNATLAPPFRMVIPPSRDAAPPAAPAASTGVVFMDFDGHAPMG